MESLSLEEFLRLPDMNVSEMGDFFKSKKWLTIGGKNPYRPNLREWAYDADDKNFVEYRNSSRQGKTWTSKVLSTIGGLEKLQSEISQMGFKLSDSRSDEQVSCWIYTKTSVRLELRKFPNMAGKEVYNVVLSII